MNTTNEFGGWQTLPRPKRGASPDSQHLHESKQELVPSDSLFAGGSLPTLSCPCRSAYGHIAGAQSRGVVVGLGQERCLSRLLACCRGSRSSNRFRSAIDRGILGRYFWYKENTSKRRKVDSTTHRKPHHHVYTVVLSE